MPEQPAMSDELLVPANGVDLCAQTFGERTDPAILLLAGATLSLDWWRDDFCARLAAGGRFVVRYDYRDTGRSTSYPPGAAPYTLRDLAHDAVGLLDALGLARAHLVGLSMGGWIGQLLALDHPDRVASLTLLSTRPVGHGPNDPDLPEMSEAFLANFPEDQAEPDWSDRAAVVDYLVANERLFAGSHPFDEAETRATAGRAFDRTANMAASNTNHLSGAGGVRWRERLGAIVAPTLVAHGTEDPLFPYGNAEALAREIPRARLLPLERVGHEVPPRAVWDVLIPAILAHTAGA